MVDEVREKCSPHIGPFAGPRNETRGHILPGGAVCVSDLILPRNDAVALDHADTAAGIQDAEAHGIADPPVVPAVVKREGAVCLAEPFDHGRISVKGLMIPCLLHNSGSDCPPSGLLISQKAVL